MRWFYRDDVRQAVRSLRRRPSATILVAVSLALGIAGATTTFSLADAILWHPLPFRGADRFVRIGITPPPGTRLPADVALDALRGRRQMFEGVYPFGLDSAIITIGGEPEAVTLAELAPGLLDALGVTPVHGRLLAPNDFLPGSNVVVASEDLWRRVQRAEPGVSAPTILVEGVPTTIVGVMPDRFTFPVGRVAFWRPLVASTGVPRITALGLLKRNLSIDEAAVSTRGVTPEQSGGLLQRVSVMPFVVVQPTTANTLYVLMGAVALLLLIAVTNAAHVIVSETTRRDTETAVRVALGATWLAIARQFMVQALVVSSAATVIAVLVSVWVLRATVASVPYLLSFQALRPIAVDWRALLCAAVVATVAGLGAASFAMLRTRRLDTSAALRKRATGMPSRGGLGRMLTATQLAIAIALLSSAGTLGRSLMAAEATGLDADPDHVVEVMVQLTTARLADEPALRAALDRLRAAAAQLPGVIDATIAYSQPPSLSSRALSDSTVEGGANDLGGTVWYGRIDEGFFNTLGIRVLAGRDISAGDTADAEPAVVVSRALGERLWPGRDPIGRRFRPASEEPWRVVVGVVANVTNVNVDQAQGEMAFYTPRSQSPSWWFEGLTARTVPPASGIVPDLRALVRSHLPESPIIAVMTGRDRLNGLNARARFVSSIIATFAVVALVLALVGVYGAFRFFVGQRTREMAVRLAVGASPAMVIRLVLQSSLRLVAAGLAAGIPLAIGATIVLRSVATGLPPADPFVLAAAAIGLTVAAMCTTYLPARRASRIDPVDALRQG